MKDATRLIQPEDINTSKRFYSAFGNSERENSANLIVRFCQRRELGWTPFTYADIDGYCRGKGMKHAFWMNGLEKFGIHIDNPEAADRPSIRYSIRHEFVSRCYKSSPME